MDTLELTGRVPLPRGWVAVTSLFSRSHSIDQNGASLSLFYSEKTEREISLLRRKTEGFLW